MLLRCGKKTIFIVTKNYIYIKYITVYFIKNDKTYENYIR